MQGIALQYMIGTLIVLRGTAMATRVSVTELPCWEITKCTSEECSLYRQPVAHAKPCWELARDLDDYRSALNVCKDCIVYVSKQGSALLSEEELEKIVSNKMECVLATKCPNLGEDKKIA